jgi:hypothetical protein
VEKCHYITWLYHKSQSRTLNAGCKNLTVGLQWKSVIMRTDCNEQSALTAILQCAVNLSMLGMGKATS